MSEGRLDRYGTNFDNWVNEDNKVDCLPLWKFFSKSSGETGLSIEFEDGRDVMSEIAETIPAFNNVSYQAMDEQAGIQLDLGKGKKTAETK
jgi:NADH-quinone oxidoreductase subunit G